MRRRKKEPEQKRNPNVLFISADDLNNWLRCLNGHSNTKTPHIDKLAAQRVLFINTHCHAFLCGPSRASIMSGLENSEHADNTVVLFWSDHGYRLAEKGTFTKHALWESATKATLMFVAPNLPKGKVIDQPAEMLYISNASRIVRVTGL